MNGIILSSILSGTRIQSASEGFAMGVDKTQELLPHSQFEPKNTIKPSLVIGEKIVDYKVFMANMNIGTLASSVSVSVDPHYSLLYSHLLGTRVGYDGADAFPSPVTFANEVVRTYTGISTYGIGYTPVVTDTSTKSELRRWPRNWYGDNIKN